MQSLRVSVILANTSHTNHPSADRSDRSFYRSLALALALAAGLTGCHSAEAVGPAGTSASTGSSSPSGATKQVAGLAASESILKMTMQAKDQQSGQTGNMAITNDMWMAPEIPERDIDLLAPIWHFMDLTPQGRGNWYANLAYGTKVQAAST